MAGAVTLADNDRTRADDEIRAIRSDEQVGDFISCEIGGDRPAIEGTGVAFARSEIDIVIDHRRGESTVAVAQVNGYLIPGAAGRGAATNCKIRIAVAVKISRCYP